MVKRPEDITLFWHKGNIYNFGDWITPYVYEVLHGGKPKRAHPKNNESTILGAGSILHNLHKEDHGIVWGTGTMSQKGFARPKKILAVRGPLTRELCLSQNYDCPKFMVTQG